MSSFEDACFNDKRRLVITSPFDPHLQFLHDLGDLAKGMSPALISIKVKSLTHDTSSNLSHTCYGLNDLATFLLNTASMTMLFSVILQPSHWKKNSVN